MGCEVSCTSLRINHNIVINTGSLDYSGGRRKSWCSGKMINYQEELRLRRQPTKLPMTMMLKSVGIKQE